MVRRSRSFTDRVRKIVSFVAVAFLVGGTTTYIAGAASAVTPIPDTAITLTSSSYMGSDSAQLVPKSGSFTYQTWFKRSSTSGYYSMLYSQGNTGNLFYVQPLGNKGIYWTYGSYSANLGWDYPNDQWTHISFTYSESADKKANFVRIYVNGDLSYSWSMGSTVLSSSSSPDFSKSYIGAYSKDLVSTQYRFHGQIDETRIYKRALSVAEVRESMHTYAPVSDSSLVAYYDFNHASSTTEASKNRATGVSKALNSDFTLTGTRSLDPIAKEGAVGTQKYVAFTRSYISSTGGWPVPAGAATINYLAVGGGGGGGARHAGGGGAGAAIDAVGAPVTPGTQLTVQVGESGLAGVNAGNGANGGESFISGTTFRTTAPGGGGGGGGGKAGLVGASGGGGGAAWGGGANGTVGFGNKGGNAKYFRYDNGGENWHGGGGGGAGSAGLSSSGVGDSMTSGAGGTGKAFAWFGTTARSALQAEGAPVGQASGTSVFFAGGGAGGKWGFGRAGAAGLGGGGNAYATPGLPNSGGGGGAGAGGTGGYGGTGVVIVAYGTVPNVPKNLSARPMTEEQVDLTWDTPDVNGALVSSYLIEYWLETTPGTVLSKEVAHNSSLVTQKHSITGLTEASKYLFTVKAKNSASTGAATGSVNAKTWYKVVSEDGNCVEYVSDKTGVSTTLSASRDSCVVTFTDTTVRTEWALPTGVSKLDTLVVGGGGGGGSNAGSGGSGGSVVDLNADLGTSKFTKFEVSVGSGGAPAVAGSASTFRGTDGANTIAITSTGGRAGKSSTTAVDAAIVPTTSIIGSALVVTERTKTVGRPGGQGTTTASQGFSAVGGYSPSSSGNGSVFTGSYVGGGGGGSVASGPTVSNLVYVDLREYEDSSLSRKTTVAVVELPATFGLSYPSGTGFYRTVPSGTLSAFKYKGLSAYKIEAYDDSPSRVFLSVFFDTALVDGEAFSYTKPSLTSDAVIAGGYYLANFSLTSTWSTTYLTRSDLLVGAPASSSTFQNASSGNGSSGGGTSASHTVGSNASVLGTLSSAQAGALATGGGGGAGIATGGAGDESGAAGGSGVVKIQYLLVSPPLVTASPEDLTVAVGESASFEAVFASEVSRIQWQESINAGITWTDIAGAVTLTSTTSRYTIAAVTDADNGKRYRALGINQKGAATASAPTMSAFLTVLRDAETLPVGAFCDGTSTQNGLTTTAGHGKVFYIDTGQGQEIDAGYVAYNINSVNERDDLWVELSGFSGGVLSLADPSTSSMPLGKVAANGSGAAFFMLKATAATTVAQAHVLRIYNQKPSIGNPAPIYECNFAFSRVEETIKAAANKVDSIVATSAKVIGSTLQITVKGDSGTIGQGNDIDGRMFWLIPAARSNWPVNAVRLEKTNLSLFDTSANRDSGASGANPLASFDNTLRVNNSNGLPSNSRVFWTATYTYRIIGPAATKVPIVPIAMISSGTQIKHTDVASIINMSPPNGATGGLDITNPDIKLAVTKNAEPNVQVREDGTTRFQYYITLTNSGTADLVVDEVIDAPDVKAAYVAGSSTYSEAVIRDPGKIGTTNNIAYSGPLTVPANQSRVLKYSMAIETCKAGSSFSMQNTATAKSGPIIIGSGSATQSLVNINGNCGESEIDVFVEDVPIPTEVTTSQADSVTTTTATINGLVDPNGVSGNTIRFQYSTSSTLSGTTSVANAGVTNSDLDAYGVDVDLTDLTPNTTYYYRAEVLVDGKWVVGEILSFKTDPSPATPSASTSAVTDIVTETTTRVTFNGTLDANSSLGGVKVKFEYALKTGDTCPASGTLTDFMQSETTFGTFTDAIYEGSGAAQVSFVQTGLTANTDYCVRIVGYYGASYNTTIAGEWVSFRTAEKTPQEIIWKTGTAPLPAGGSVTVQAFATSTLVVTYTSVDPTVCTVNATTGVVTAVATSGNCVITATQAGNDNFYAAEPATLSFIISPPVITTTSLADGKYGSVYSQQIEATGGNGTYSSWSIVSNSTYRSELPTGLVLNSSTGVLSGTPTTAGIFVIYVTTVSNGISSEPQSLTITVSKIPIAVTASSHDLIYGDGAPTIYPIYDFPVVPGITINELVLNTAPNVAPTCSTNYTRGLDAGDESSITSCSGGWATNFSYSYTFGAVTIKPLEIRITALDAARKVGETGTVFRYSTSPALPPGQTLADVISPSTPSLTTDAIDSSPAGTYTITPTATLAVNRPYVAVDAETGATSTAFRSNYSLTTTVGRLVITDKTIPTLEITTSTVRTVFGSDLSGKLDAKATAIDPNVGPITVPGTYRYFYLDSDGNEVVVTNSSKLPAGTYTILVSFTPADGTTYQGPIRGSFTLVVEPFAITLRALDGAKQNEETNTALKVSADPRLNYLFSPALPAGQTLADVFSNGVTVKRERSGTASGEYPKNNTSIRQKEGLNTTHPVRPIAEFSPNYAVTMVEATFTVTGRKVPDVVAANSSKTVVELVGPRLNAKSDFDGEEVAGTFEYFYIDEAGAEVTLTADRSLSLGLHSVMIKFTPNDMTTYFGPVLSSMFINVGPVIQNSGGSGGGGLLPGLTPVEPNPIKPKPKPGPNNPSSGGGSSGGYGSATTDEAAGGNNGGSRGPSSPINQPRDPSKNGPYTIAAPSVPGFGSLIPRLSPIDPDSGLIEASESGGANRPIDLNAWNQVLSKMTIDLGQGVQQATADLVQGATSSLEQAKRTLSQMASERLGGFAPPGSGVRIEVLGARTGARFVVADLSQIDSKSLLVAMTNSIAAQKTDFFTIQNFMIDQAPEEPSAWSEEEKASVTEFFAGAGLSAPSSLADIEFDEVETWVGIEAWANTYVPGSVVYLTVTSNPLVIASAVADNEGRVVIEGAMPLEYLGAGEHRIRLVGTRSLDGVFVDDRGEIQVTDKTMTEIERFDLQTQATIAFVGTNEQGGNHVAMRVIPLIPTAPWWTLILLGLVGLAVLALRRRNRYFVGKQQALGPVAILVAALPAVLLGWLSTVTEVMWVGLLAAAVLAVGAWLIRPRARARAR